MPIEHTKGGTVITGDSIDFFRLAALKGAVSLEMHGVKMRRGPVLWKQVAREFGVKGNKAAVYRWLCNRVEELRAQQEHRVEEDGRLKREVGGKEVQ
jgi:hypothetical protein